MNPMDVNLKHYYLTQMGITPWILREHNQLERNLSALEKKVATCEACKLHKTRMNTVFARGNAYARIMIVGEAPGFHEDQQGKPFVGKAGGLLDKMLKSVGFGEDDVYIANVLKCRPPNNRDPHSDEIQACTNHLKQQIALINPQLLLAVGKFAGQFLLQTNLTLSKMRLSTHEYQGIPVLVSYHPAYLLRNPVDKKKAYADLLKVKQLSCLRDNA